MFCIVVVLVIKLFYFEARYFLSHFSKTVTTHEINEKCTDMR